MRSTKTLLLGTVAALAAAGATAAPSSAAIVGSSVVWKKSGVYKYPQYKQSPVLRWKYRGQCVKSDNTVSVRRSPDGRYWTQVILSDGRRGWMRSGSISPLDSYGCPDGPG